MMETQETSKNTSMFVCKNHGFLMFPVDIPFNQSMEAANSPVSNSGRVRSQVGRTALMEAVEKKHMELADTLLSPGNEKSQICQLAKGPQKHGLHC